MVSHRWPVVRPHSSKVLLMVTLTAKFISSPPLIVMVMSVIIFPVTSVVPFIVILLIRPLTRSRVWPVVCRIPPRITMRTSVRIMMIFVSVLVILVVTVSTPLLVVVASIVKFPFSPLTSICIIEWSFVRTGIVLSLVPMHLLGWRWNGMHMESMWL